MNFKVETKKENGMVKSIKLKKLLTCEMKFPKEKLKLRSEKKGLKFRQAKDFISGTDTV